MKRAKKPTNDLELTAKQADAVSLVIELNNERIMKAFVVAGAEALSTHFGFSPEQLAQWVEITTRTGTSYARGAGLRTSVEIPVVKPRI